MPDAAASAPDHEREARIARRTDARCLAHMLQWARRTGLLLPSGVLLAWVAWQLDAGGWAVAWFAAWVGAQAWIHRSAGRLRARPGPDARAGIVQLTRAYWASGVLHALLLPLFFVDTDGLTAKMLITLLLGGVVGFVLVATSGSVGAYIGGAVPPTAMVAVAWSWHGGVLGWGLALMYAGFAVFGAVGVRQQRRSWEELVRLLDDNEKLAASLAAERDRAEAASQAKTRFFAAASHDLRQPLHALSINATTLELVAGRSDDALLKELSQGIGGALRQSRALLDGLLDISRLDAGAVKTRLAACDVGTRLRAVRDEFAALAAQRGLFLEVEVAHPAPWVMTDADQLMRILANLVDNALKFTREGGVTLAAHEEAPGRVLVSVSDTGPGIAAAERERVFEEFYQVGNPSRDRAQGLGLGLAIVRRTAALIGVELRLAAGPTGGASFELRMPAAAPSAPAHPDGSAGEAAEDGGPLCVLVVDDEAAVLDSLCTYLRQLGWTARGVASGSEAAQALADGLPVDALVVDFRLRDETGVDVIDRLRRSRPGLAALIVTGDTAPHRLGELEGRGIGVLHKPLDGAGLASAIVGAVRRPVALPTPGHRGP
ncbi:MAG: response regulator [Rubrivivax sp.]|nr:response regulator [Rubrivivax sp.]